MFDFIINNMFELILAMIIVYLFALFSNEIQNKYDYFKFVTYLTYFFSLLNRNIKLGIPIILLVCYFQVVDYVNEEKCQKRQEYEEKQKNRIKNELPPQKITYDNNRKPIKPILFDFHTTKARYDFVERYENKTAKEKLKIKLPANYFSPNGLYEQYLSYKIAYDLYQNELESYNLKQICIEQQKKSYWQKYWKEKCKNGFEFEIAVGNLYQEMGYNVKVTQGTGDGGVDIVISKDGKKGIIQCKAHNHPVGPNDIRALWGVKDDFKADYVIFVAYSGVTCGGYEFAKNKNYEIIDVNDLINMSIKTKKFS